MILTNTLFGDLRLNKVAKIRTALIRYIIQACTLVNPSAYGIFLSYNCGSYMPSLVNRITLLISI